MKEYKNLGELIKSFGLMKHYVRKKVNDAGVQCNESTFSKWCTGKHKPNNRAVRRVLGEVLGVSEETISNII